jgi:hypothetical protein
LGDPDELRTRYLWDRLYPDIDGFAIAIGRFEPPAVARLVEVDGLYAAEKILGRRVWKRFDQFKQLIHTVRRQQLEGLVRWRETQLHASDKLDRKQPVGPLGDLVRRLK